MMGKENILDAYPLTQLQSGMLFHSEYSFDTSTYHDIFTYHLKGVYSHKVFEESLQKLISRHDILRTAFNLTDYKEPIQIVYKDVNVNIEEEDIRGFSQESCDEIVKKWVEQEKKNVFDWKIAPLFRIKIHLRDDNRFDVTLSFHHSILDGWSVSIMMKELFTMYIYKLKAINYSQESVENVTFSDYIIAEREAIESEECKFYWENKLKDFSFKPLSRWEGYTENEGSKVQYITVSQKNLKQFEEISRSEGIPIKNILLAVHLRVMSLISQKQDIVTGMVTNGRSEKNGGDSVLGLFLNVVPFRISLENDTWRTFIHKTFKCEQELLAYRRYPQSMIKKCVNKDLNLDTMFNFINFQISDEIKLNGEYLQLVGVDAFEETNYTFLCQASLSPITKSLEIILKYDSNYFTKEQIEFIQKCYSNAIVSLTSNIDEKINNKEVDEYIYNNFSNEIPINNLPTDYKRLSTTGFHKNEIEFDIINKDVLMKLNYKDHDELSSNMIMILNILLFKYLGKNDILIDFNTTRQKVNGEDDFNYLIRNIINEDQNYVEFYELVRENILNAYKYQNKEFMDKMKIKYRETSGNKEFISNIIFTMNECKFRDEGISYIYDINLNVFTFDDQIKVKIFYNSKLFNKESIIRFKGYFLNLLNQLMNDSTITLKNLDIITKEDEEILLRVNNTYFEFEKNKTIFEIFEEQVERTPNNIAVVSADKKLTYRELNEKANALARKLRREGVGPDYIVGIMAERSLEMIVGVMAILKAGGAYLPIDPSYPEARVDYILENSKTTIVLAQDKFKDKLKNKAMILNLNDETLYMDHNGNLETLANANNLAYVIYTSGTTGNPKGVMIEHRSIVNRINWMQRKYPINNEDVILQKTTYSFDVSVWEILWWSLVGATVRMLIPGGEKDPNILAENIKDGNVTVIHFVPSMFSVFIDYIIDEDRVSELVSLKKVFTSGEALKPEHSNLFNNMIGKVNDTRLINLYGPTEAAVDVTYYDCQENEQLIPIGKPIDNIRIYILDKNNKLVPLGVTGELYITGVGVARGYLNNEKLTAEKFINNPYEPGEKMYKTGDLARWLPDGNIEYLGRIDHQVKIRGFRIELGEIESNLLKLEGIKEVIVLDKGIESNKYLYAYYVGDRKYDISDLRGELKKTLPEYMIPSYFIKLEEIPLTPNGKVNRKALPELDENFSTGVEYEAPRNEIEEKLAEIWEEVLGIKNIGINDNFFSLSGDSIRSVQVMSIAKEKGIKFSIKELFDNPTIKELARISILDDIREEKAEETFFDLLSDEDRKNLIELKN